MPERDFFRDTWVRYLGYANEVGEAFRPVVPSSVVVASYKVAGAYVIADTVAKSLKKLRKDGRPTKVLVAAGDAFIWQTLASVVLPGLAINRISFYTGRVLKQHVTKMPPNVRTGLTVFIGLASIPIIVHPIDCAVDVFMNMTYRQIFGS